MTAALVPAGHVREAVAARVTAGVPYRRIAEHAGRAPAVVRRLLWGVAGRPPTSRLREDVAEALLAAATAPVVTPPGARRRLQALCAAGYSLTGLAPRIGADPTHLRDIAYGHVVPGPGMCARIGVLFAELNGCPPPEDTWGERVSASKARGQATRHAWAPWGPRDTELPRRPAPFVRTAWLLLGAIEDLGDIGPAESPFCAPRSWLAELELEMADVRALNAAQVRELRAPGKARTQARERAA